MNLRDFKKMNEIVSSMARLNADVRDHVRWNKEPSALKYVTSLVSGHLEAMVVAGLLENVPEYVVSMNTDGTLDVTFSPSEMLSILGVK